MNPFYLGIDQNLTHTFKMVVNAINSHFMSRLSSCGCNGGATPVIPGEQYALHGQN